MQASDLSLLRRVLAEVRQYRRGLVALFLLGLCASPLKLLAPLPLKIVVDNVLDSKPLPAFLQVFAPAAVTQSSTAILVIAVALMLLAALLSHLHGIGYGLLRAQLAERMVLAFRGRLFNHAQRLSLTYHDMRGTADSIYRVQNDAAAVQYLTIDGILPFVSSAFTILAMLYVTLRIDAELSLVALAVTPLLYAISQFLRPKLRRQSREVRKIESRTLSVVQESLGVVRVVKAFGREEHEQQRYVRQGAEGMKARIRMALIEGWLSLSIGMTTTIGTAVVLWIGVRHIQSGLLTVGDLLLVLAYIGQLYDPLKTIGRKAASLQTHFASLERAFALLDEAPEVVERPRARRLVRAHGEIRFESVSFSYDGDPCVLNDVCINVPAGARVGIQGKTGAGKSTLMSLLLRFYDVSQGRILLDGIDIRDYRIGDLRNQYSVVLQDSVLFSTTVAQNIAYARPEATVDDIVQAAKLANAHDFISALPDGYETLVGERGMRLSGGERQRIALARAFLKNAPILILDEPTSALDSGTEAAILEALDRLMHGRTAFIVAHRLSTLGQCDIRLEIRDGRICEVRHTVAVN
jgi:ATP-binding cassette subfamily B protein